MLPIFFENSKLPDLLSKIAPFRVGGFSFSIFVWVRGVASDRLRRHETTHFLQQVELLFIGQWLLYLLWYLILLVYHRDRYLAYRLNPFEIECYSTEDDVFYNDVTRTFCAWVQYIPQSFEREKDA